MSPTTNSGEELRGCPVWNDGRPHECSCGKKFTDTESQLAEQLRVARIGIAEINRRRFVPAEVTREVRELLAQMDAIQAGKK